MPEMTFFCESITSETQKLWKIPSAVFLPQNLEWDFDGQSSVPLYKVQSTPRCWFSGSSRFLGPSQEPLTLAAQSSKEWSDLLEAGGSCVGRTTIPWKKNHHPTLGRLSCSKKGQHPHPGYRRHLGSQLGKAATPLPRYLGKTVLMWGNCSVLQVYHNIYTQEYSAFFLCPSQCKIPCYAGNYV